MIKKINWKVRVKNPMFWAMIVLSFLAPTLAYMGLNLSDLTSWAKVGEVILSALKNPYVLVTALIAVYNAIVDPTTAGLKDSKQAMTYEEPKRED